MGKDRGLLKKIIGVTLVAMLIWVGFSIWLFNVSIYDEIYVKKSGISYLNVLTLNGMLYISFGILIGLALLNPIMWYSAFKRKFKLVIVILLIGIVLALVFFSAIGSDMALQLLLLRHAGDILPNLLNWLWKVYLAPLSFSGLDLYNLMPVFDLIELLKMLYLYLAIVLMLSIGIVKSWSIAHLARKAMTESQGEFFVLNLMKTFLLLAKLIFAIVMMGYAFLWYPTFAYDVTSHIFRASILVSLVLTMSYIVLEVIPLKKARLKNILFILAILVVILGYSIPQAYYRTIGGWDANKVSYEFMSKIKPHIELVKLLNGLDGIMEVSESPGGIEDLGGVRLINHDFITSRTNYELSRKGIPWITGSEPSMIYFKDNHLYWVVLTAPVIVEATDVETASSFIYTHSEVILAFDATTGKTVPLDQVLGTSVSPIYYGIGGLFEDREIVFVNTGKWKEAGTMNYTSLPDYVFSGWVRLAYFLMRGRLDIASGGYGETLNALIIRDAYERVLKIKVPFLNIETDPRTGVPAPYPVIDPDGNLYLAFSFFIEKPIYTDYAFTERYGVEEGGYFRKPFSIALVNVMDGSIQGYMSDEALNDNNYVLDTLKSLYPSWARPIPSWLKPQLRYSKNLMWRIIDICNTYRIGSLDYDSWYRSTDMLDFPRDANGEVYSQSVFDIRYVSLGGSYVALCVVENYRQNPGASVNIVGAYVFTPDSKKFIEFSNRIPKLSTVVDSILHHPTVQQILTLHQTRGVSWVEGNLMVQLVNNTPVFILPFYSISAQVAYVTMVVVYNPQTSRIGIYQINNVEDWIEVSESTLMAYSSTVYANVSLRLDYFKQVKAFLISNGLEVVEPLSVSANVVYRIGYVKVEEFRNNANSTLRKLVDFCNQYGLKKVNVWTEKTDNKEVINVGALVMTIQGIELHLVQLETG